ncbi:MAG: aspartate dehydrogenase [Thermoplasmata archaeon]|nr:aspartate dehydrogenase [Thermoplasmata archaeon]
MKVCLIGCGFIGTTLAEAMEGLDEVEEVFVTDKSSEKSSDMSSFKKVRYVDDVLEVLDDVDLVIEAASQQAVHQYAPLILEKGRDILVMSAGAFADEALLNKCRALAKKNGCRVYIPTGALFGIDGLGSASMGVLNEVSLTSTKPTGALKDNEYLKEKGFKLEELREAKVVFEGCAKDAVQNFPKTANVAAVLSLAGIGFEKTKVKIIADPNAKTNRHEVFVKGEFGEMKTEVENIPSPTNPSTSVLAALSAISGVKKITGAVWAGL